MTKIKFRGSNDLRDNNVTTKNIGTDKVIAIFFGRNILKEKNKKVLISIFIINIRVRFEGGKKIAKELINPRIKIRNISFFPNFSLASIINFNYNRKLWLK